MMCEMSLRSYEAAVDERAQSLTKANAVGRFWDKDVSLWNGDKSIAEFMGWIDVTRFMTPCLPEIHEFRQELKSEGFTHVVLMGMGGSSLGPLIFQRTCRPTHDGLELLVLDSTEPGTVLMVERRVPLDTTLFIVASKSGTTAEPNAFSDYFYEKVRKLRGDQAGRQFAAITDPGTKMTKIAEERQFRKVFLNWATIGGRYSALSYFGMVPAGLMGIDIDEILARANRMVDACEDHDVEENPGFGLGAALGELALQGRDKVTFIVPDKLETLGLWLEQLIAESTGKEGKGILPIATERPGDPSVYGNDRVFVDIRLADEDSREIDREIQSLHDAGHPVVTLDMASLLDLGGEFYRWEVATAVAGAVIGINPFDQPNVQESKDITNKLIAQVREQGSLPVNEPTAHNDRFEIYDGSGSDPVDSLISLLRQATTGNYIAFQAYLTETEEVDKALQDLRTLVRDKLRVATTLGYGPRFLHSTGQFHKGGPNSGLFVQITEHHSEDAPIPGQPYSFGTFCDAQAQGDLEALKAHGRRAIRANLKSDAAETLRSLVSLLDERL